MRCITSKEWEEQKDSNPELLHYSYCWGILDPPEIELKNSLEVLDHFHIDYSGNTIKLNSGAFSVIMNPKTQFPLFLGLSLASIATFVAKRLGKEIEWEKDENGRRV